MSNPSAASRELSALFTALTPGSPLALEALVFVPLYRAGVGPDAELLEEGLSRGHTEVTEVSAQGQVNAVRVRHSGPLPLLLLDGEELIGAKQNRVLNASFLIPPGGDVEVPVSCVEAGRWRQVTPAFRGAETMLSSEARGLKLGRVTARSSGYDADQGAVWRDVARYSSRVGAHSPTGAFADAARPRLAAAEELLPRLAPAPGQAGLAVLNGERLISLEAFGSAALFHRAWRKVARGILAELYEQKDPPATPPAALVERALCRLTDAPLRRQPAPGCGETLHGAVGELVIGGIAHGGELYHAFAAAR